MAGNLSTELLNEILSYALKSDLKSVRLASKTFRAISSAFLFARVYASVHLKDLEVLSAISQHPDLRLLVREVVYAGVFFNLSGFSSQGGIVTRASRPRRPENPSRGLQFYFDRLKEQERTIHTAEDLAIICAALAKMPNIRKLTLTNHWDLPCDFKRPKVSPLHDDPLEDQRDGGPLSWTYPEFAGKPSQRPRTVLYDLYNGDQSYYIDHGFELMCRAFSINNIKVQELSIDYMPTGSGKPANGISVGSFYVHKRDLVHFCNTFRSLRRIRFSLSMRAIHREREMLQSGNLPRVLAAAHLLEDLSFDFAPLEQHALPFDEILGEQKWHHLRSISLSSIHMHGTDLTGFFERQHDTLRIVRLDNIRLKTGSWRDMIEWMRSFMVLEKASLQDLSEVINPGNLVNVISADVERYLLHGGGCEFYGEKKSCQESREPCYRSSTPINGKP